MRQVVLHTIWKGRQIVEVPDDFEDTGFLEDIPENVLQEIDSSTAELVDWEFFG